MENNPIESLIEHQKNCATNSRVGRDLKSESSIKSLLSSEKLDALFFTFIDEHAETVKSFLERFAKDFMLKFRKIYLNIAANLVFLPNDTLDFEQVMFFSKNIVETIENFKIPTDYSIFAKVFLVLEKNISAGSKK